MKIEDLNTSQRSNRVSRVLLIVSIIAVLGFWPLAAVILLQGKLLGLGICLFAMGISQGPLLAGYALARDDRKQRWRWLVLTVTGFGILMFMLIDAVNLDIDGFFELLILGIMGPAIGHTIITTIIGPLIFGRVLCGWGCWRAMVLERLPVGKGSGRLKGVWLWMPYAGLAASLAAAVLFPLLTNSRSTGSNEYVFRNSFWPIVAGVAVYYTAAITLAFALRDQRAFCKYLCPTGLILRWTSRHSLLHVSAQADTCNECEACTNVCPMDIPVAARAKIGAPIGNGDCILCQRCVETCPTGALRTIFKK